MGSCDSSHCTVRASEACLGPCCTLRTSVAGDCVRTFAVAGASVSPHISSAVLLWDDDDADPDAGSGMISSINLGTASCMMDTKSSWRIVGGRHKASGPDLPRDFPKRAIGARRGSFRHWCFSCWRRAHFGLTWERSSWQWRFSAGGSFHAGFMWDMSDATGALETLVGLLTSSGGLSGVFDSSWETVG